MNQERGNSKSRGKFCSIFTYPVPNSPSSLAVVFFFFLGRHPWHMEVPRLWVELELPLLAYPTTTAMQDPSRACGLHHSSRQCWIPNPLSEARDRTCILLDTCQVHYHWATTGTPSSGLEDSSLPVQCPELWFLREQSRSYSKRIHVCLF